MGRMVVVCVAGGGHSQRPGGQPKYGPDDLGHKGAGLVVGVGLVLSHLAEGAQDADGAVVTVAGMEGASVE